MAKKSVPLAQYLLDMVRPAETDGPLESVVLATYGLSLDQPNFFEHDLLPALLGLGGVRDRGYTAPIALERKLAETYCALICDAHALAQGARPSLRMDVIPVARPRHHAKIVLIHRQKLLRVIISSANLSHDGYRTQREITAVLDFRPEGTLPIAILQQMIDRWLDTLGEAATKHLRSALEEVVTRAKRWPTRPAKGFHGKVEVIFGGGQTPLWRQLTDAWPMGEPFQFWRICSPYWPGADCQTTPFEQIAYALQQRGASLEDAQLEVICAADVVGEQARPVFPFGLLQGLRARKFPVQRGRIVPARLETLEHEVPEGYAEGKRTLHAKYVLLRGPNTVIAFLGSANFTNSGFGVSGPANIEAGLLLTCPASHISEEGWRPPLVESGAVDWATKRGQVFALPPSEPEEPVDWPTHLRSVDLDIDWTSPDPAGSLLLALDPEGFVPTVILAPRVTDDTKPEEITTVDSFPAHSEGVVRASLGPGAVRRLLMRRHVGVRWGEPSREVPFPINIVDTAKPGLPSVLGVRPDELQLLAYFHGLIAEDDLLKLLEQRAQQERGKAGENKTSEELSSDLQNYIIREFVEGLYGLEEMLKHASYSPRSLEIALLGEFSVAALADRITTAFREGRRSPTAAAFQLVELLRVVVGVSFVECGSESQALENVRKRAVDRLLAFSRQAAVSGQFCKALRDKHFAKYVRASLPREIAERFLRVAELDSVRVGKPGKEAVDGAAT